MKKKLPQIYVLFVIAVAGLCLASSGGRATAANSGNTGAPGDDASTCVTCHGSASTTVQTGFTLLDDDGSAITAYVPGTVYRALVNVDFVSGDVPEAYGFQMVSLIDSDNSDVASFANPDVNTTVAVAGSTGRQYAEHAGPNRDASVFEVEWTAPEAGSGPVTFYVGANGVNLNGTTGGDGASVISVNFTESDASSTGSELADGLSLFPNPVSNQLILKSEFSDRDMMIQIRNAQGILTLRTQELNQNIEVSDWNSGLYVAQWISGQGQILQTQKFIKL